MEDPFEEMRQQAEQTALSIETEHLLSEHTREKIEDLKKEPRYAALLELQKLGEQLNKLSESDPEYLTPVAQDLARKMEELEEANKELLKEFREIAQEIITKERKFRANQYNN